MNGDLAGRIERLQEQLCTEPLGLLTVILLQAAPLEKDTALREGFHRLGRYATCFFLGGTAQEQQRELKLLKKSGKYDRDPYGPRPICDGSERERTG